MGGMSDLDIVLRETMRDIDGMVMRLKELNDRIERVYGPDPVSAMRAQERIPDQLFEWSRDYKHVADAQSIGCSYHLLGAMEESKRPQLILYEMDSGAITELDSWDEANGLNYGAALHMMANHVQQDLEREHAEHPHRMGGLRGDRRRL